MDRLCLLHTESSLGWGGQEVRVLTEMQGFNSRGHRTFLVCPPEARIFAEAPRFGVEAIAAPIGRRTIAGATTLRALFKTIGPNVIVTHSSTDSWLSALATRFWDSRPSLLRVRHISAPVSTSVTSRWLYGTAAAHVVTTGERLRADLIERLSLLPNRVTSVPTGINLSSFVPRSAADARRDVGVKQVERGLVVGIVATLRSWKGHRYLLDAWASLPREDFPLLLIVGDGPGRDNLQRQANALGVGNCVLMPGNQIDVAPWFAALDVFALPSYANEGVPQAIMQAMAMGLPVISTPVGSIPEIVIEGKTGLLIEPRDIGAIRQALIKLRDDPAFRARIGSAARAFALANFSSERMLDSMETIIRGLQVRRLD